MGTISRILTPAEATSLQTALNAHGARLEVDGHFGELSRLALIRFQHDNNLPETGNPDLVTCSALGIAPITTPAPAPAPKLTPNPVVQAIGAFALQVILNRLFGRNINMDSTKPWYTSQTVIANIVAVIGVVLTFFHIGFNEADQATVVTAAVEIITGLAAVWGIIGRLMATKKIG